MRRKRHNPPQLIMALVAMAGLLVGLVGEDLHSLLEPHRWCAVHETVEHGERAEPISCESLDESAESELVSFDVVVPEELEDEHDACRVLFLANETALPELAQPRPALAATPGLCFAITGEQPAHRSIARLRLAPKQSPPTA